jgi:phosphopantetheine--protein transferase-like protein
MIIGVGLDVVVVKALTYDFIQDNFTKGEQVYCNGSIPGLLRWEKYASIIAVKEAFKKSLGGVFTNIPPHDIEVQLDENGRSFVTLCCPEKYHHKHVDYTIHVSTTCGNGHATAIVIIEEHGDTWYNVIFKSKKKG